VDARSHEVLPLHRRRVNPKRCVDIEVRVETHEYVETGE
jgi:hypothetical protein